MRAYPESLMTLKEWVQNEQKLNMSIPSNPELLMQLVFHRCPHCAVAKPLLSRIGAHTSHAHSNRNERFWAFYECMTCGGIVTAWGMCDAGEVIEMYPSAKQVDETIPNDAADYLQQALESIHAPAGAVMLTASAVDAMLKEKGYTEGVLDSRIKKAAQDHLITAEMAEWAHEIRLDANAQRHADQAPTRPTTKDAQRCIEFALALAEFLFVLPARVRRGRQPATNVKIHNP